MLCLTQREQRHEICAELAQQGFIVLAETIDNDIQRLIDLFDPDLAIADLTNDKASTGLLSNGKSIPVIMIGNSDATAEQVRLAWNDGAHQLLLEPMSTEELTRSVRSLLDSNNETDDGQYGIDNLHIDERGFVATLDGNKLDLTKKEFVLLAALARHCGIVLSKRQLLAIVWGYDDYDENLVEVHVSSLRRKMEKYDERKIETVRGVGYVIRGTGKWGLPPTNSLIFDHC